MTAEAAALAWLRNPARNVDEIIAALNAMCAGQDGIVADHLCVCASNIQEDTPDPVWTPEPDDIPQPQTINKYDQPRVPAFLMEAS